MKNKLLIVVLLILIVSISGQLFAVTRIGITNPTQRNLEKVIFLVENHLIDIDSLEIVGIFHESQTASIGQSESFIEEKGADFVSIEQIHGRIPKDSLFSANECTAEFVRFFRKTDAMIFLGGPDIPPHLYGEKTFLTTALIRNNRNWELSFLYHLIGRPKDDDCVPFLEQKSDYLILGICLGMQEMNVANGGSMFQDIPRQIYHQEYYEDILEMPVDQQHKNYSNRIDNWQEDLSPLSFHQIQVNRGSYLYFNNDGRSVLVTSVHHQAVKRLGRDYRIIAASMDNKVAEAIEHKKYRNVYGIQFHPEFSVLYEDSAEFRLPDNRMLQLTETHQQFFRNFWKDFTRRVKP